MTTESAAAPAAAVPAAGATSTGVAPAAGRISLGRQRKLLLLAMAMMLAAGAAMYWLVREGPQLAGTDAP